MCENVLIPLSQKGDVAGIEAAIRDGAVTSERDADGNSPLHTAVEVPRCEIGTLAALLFAKADANAINEIGAAPLHYVALRKHNWRGVAELLLEHHASVNSVTLTGRTPLHFAAEKDVPELVAVLLEHRADRSRQDSDGNTVMHALLANEGRDTVKLDLLEMLAVDELAVLPLFALKNAKQYTVAHFCCLNGFPKCLQRLIDWKADLSSPSTLGETCLHLAARNGLVELVPAVLYSAPITLNMRDNQGNTALHYCAIFGHLDSAICLANFGADTCIKNDEKETAYTIAKKKNDDWAASDTRDLAQFLKDIKKTSVSSRSNCRTS